MSTRTNRNEFVLLVEPAPFGRRFAKLITERMATQRRGDIEHSANSVPEAYPLPNSILQPTLWGLR